MTWPTSNDAPARRPRLRRSLAMTHTSRGMLLEGGPSRQLLAGSSATSALPRLLALLDGARSPDDISTRLDLNRKQVDDAVELLDDCGLLEWVRPGGSSGFAAEHVADYMSRALFVTPSRPSCDDLAEELELATVLLDAPTVLVGSMISDLAEMGLGATAECRAEEVGDRCANVAGPCVVAAFDCALVAAPGAPDELERIAGACLQYGVPLLRFAAGPGHVEVGPVFAGVETACVRCFRHSQTQAAGDPQELRVKADATALLASLATSATLGMLTRQPPVPSPRRLARTMVPGCATEYYDIVPELTCERCVGGSPPRDAAARKALEYEWLMAKGPVFLEPGDVATPAHRDRLAELQRRREQYPTSPRRLLPAVTDIIAPSRSIDQTVLAQILARTVGFRTQPGSPNKRWAPTGGNMASVAAYICAGGNLLGLPGSMYRYDDVSHQILSIYADAVPLTKVLEGTDLDPAETDVAIILIGAVGRLSQKYGDFAWRLTHLDAGCAALQMSLAAELCGVRCEFASAWPHTLQELLELQVGLEVVTAVAGLSARPGSGQKG